MPIISSTTLTRLASPESVRESLIRQMTETVRWVELVEQLYADGVRVFVEVGPSGVLAGLTRRILAAHTDITIVQFDQRGRSPAEQLSRLRETLGLAGSPQRAVVADPLNTERAVIGRIVSFDATSRRRERNRSAALGKTSTAGRQPTPSASHNGNGHAHGRNGSIVQQTRVPVQTRASAVRNGTGSRISAADPVGGSDSYASVAAGGSSADAAPVHQAAESKELESFLVEFVVEQTGYPREIVELDADLEADLGIDSIRKAQLFGEIGQRYSLAADDSLSFDDFPTLRHLLDYMLQRIGGVGTGLPSMASSAARRDVVSSASVEPQLPAAVVGEAPVAIAEPKTADKTIDNFAAVGELSSFLIDFVIEQTGYPREIVDLDADLESDLGIDSIRKAQLFGEIGQRYGLAAEDSVSLDDFPTLQHLLDYMLPRIGGMEAGQASTVAAAFQRDAVSAAATEPPRLAAVAGEASVAVADSKTADKTVGSSAASEKLAAFLIDFVIEQTGYPQEIVELDADLEADLGIDSIRKAQLFGEIGQHYGLAVDDSVSLDDFPTLQHLLDYMLPKVAGTASEENSSPSEVMTDPVSLEVFRSGNFRLGEERGRQHAESIRRWARFVPTVASGREPVFPRALGEELDGIAAGAGVSAAAVRAAVADPTAVLGAWETAVSCTAGDSGVAVVCGRQASPVAETSNTEAGRTTLVGLPGLPAAVIGWNTSGLVAWIDGSGRSAAGNLRAATPTAVAVAAVARSARTPAEAAEILRRAAPLDGSVSLLMLPTRGLSTAGADGVLQPSGDPAAVAPPGGLFDAFLAGGEQSPAATTRLLLDSTSGVADRLSAAVHWVAVGLVDGQPVVRGGGPLAAWFDPHSLVLPQGRPPAVDEPGTAAAAAEVTRRYLLGCAPLPPAVAAARLVGERVLVLGEGAVAAAIAQAVQASGGEVTVAAVGSQQAAEAAVDAAESIGPVRHLVLAAAADRAADGSSQRINTVVTAAFFACQRWLKARNQAGEIAGATLTAVTRLGGDFGVSGKVGDVAGGGLAGLLKNIAHEFADLQVRVIDHAIEATEAAIGSETVTEICSLAGPVEVGYGASGRQQLLAVEQPLAGHGSGLEAVAAGSVWLVTGGARGVTAACGLALGKQYGLRLALVGSTRPVPLESDWLERDEAGLRELKGQLMVEAKARGEDPRQAWRAVEKSLEIARSLAACTAAGVTAKYFACDLSDEVAAGRLVAEVERSIGPIRGLLHGAGYEAACRFEKKTPAGLAATVGPKVLGLEHLLAAIDPQQLRAVIGFGSTSGRFGGHGQADYSLANDLLAKIVAKLRHGNGIPATVFHWHAWDEVGMASRPESRFVLEQFGLQFMPLAEGVGHFLREIAGGLPAAEVILTEQAFCEAAGPVRQATAAALPPQPTASLLADGSRGSLVATVATEGTVSHVGFQLDPTRDQFLLQHTQYGRPLLPAVMAAELLAQAVRAAGLAETVQELREVQIERPVNFPTDRTRTVEVRVGPENGPSVAAVGWAPVLNAAGQPAGEPRPHISGRVVIGPAEPITRQLDEQPFPFNPMVYQEDAPLHHGRAFRTLSGLFLDRSGGWARLTAPDPNVVAASRGAAGWTVPIALLDGCIVACAVYSYILLGKRVEVPLRFERLRMVAQPQVAEACTLRLFYRQHDAQETVYDFTLYGDDGQPLLALDGLHLAVVPSREAR
jgi:acyl carrier protein